MAGQEEDGPAARSVTMTDAPPLPLPTADETPAAQAHEGRDEQDGEDEGEDAGAPPVEPGPRARRLQELYAQSLRHTLRKVSWENFAGCYPTMAKGAEDKLRKVQGQMVDMLGEKCQREFENIMAVRQVVPKLNDLEALVSDASRRRKSHKGPDPTPPHLLPPSQIFSAHLAPVLASHQSVLNARLQTTQAQNSLLYDEVRRQREEIASLMAALEATVADIHSANAALAPVVEELAAESRQADADLVGRT